MAVKLRIELFPITENGEEIFHGGFYEVLKLDLVKGIASTLIGKNIFSQYYYDDWCLFDNRDRRDKQTVLQYSTDNGNTWNNWKFEETIK